jgi:hypothetical protein
MRSTVLLYADRLTRRRLGTRLEQDTADDELPAISWPCWFIVVHPARVRCAALFTAGILAAGCTSALENTPPDERAEAAALQEFQSRLAAYTRLRDEVALGLEPLASTANLVQLESRRASLAAAIVQGRKNAHQGDLIPPAAAAIIRREVVFDLAARPEEDRRHTLDEIPRVSPVLNAAYPEEEAFATVPPLLLQRLPPLPDSLQYRFMGRHIVLLDADASLVIDYVPDALSSEGS